MFPKPGGLLRIIASEQLDIAKAPTARQQVEMFDPGLTNALPNRFTLDQRMTVGRRGTKTGRGVALGIEIDQEGLRPGSRQRSSEIDSGRSFSDPAFLIRHAKDPCHDRPPCPKRWRTTDSILKLRVHF
jgi:hypothetical protein